MAGFRSRIALLHAVAFLLRFASSSFAATVAPAFIWSNSRSFGVEDHSVDYQIFTPKSLVNKLFGRYPSSQKQENTEADDLLVLFIGPELRLADIAQNTLQKTNTLHLIKNTVTTSKFSIVLPHVHFANEGESFMNILVANIEQAETPGTNIGKLRSFDCIGRNEASEAFESIHDIEEFLSSRKDIDGGKTDVLVICGSSVTKEQSEGKVLSKVSEALNSGARKYTAAYVPDLPEKKYITDLHFRQLSESPVATNETYCDEVCQTKATLLESLFVGITLIFILVLGICCMAGVQSPSRFEAPKES